MPKLTEFGAKAVAEATGVSERRVRDWLKGSALPHSKHRRALEDLVRRQCREIWLY